MSRQVLYWVRPHSASADCGVCGQFTLYEACATLQHEPHGLSRWVPRCHEHERDGIMPNDTGVELRVGGRRILDGYEIVDPDRIAREAAQEAREDTYWLERERGQ